MATVNVVVADDVDRPDGCVQAGGDAVQVDEWHLLGHGLTQAHVPVVTRIGSPVAVAQQVVGTDLVLVGAGSAFDKSPTL